MRLTRLTNYLLSHREQAYLITFLVALMPVVGTVSILFAGLVTLRKNIVEGAILTALSVLPIVITLYYYPARSIELMVAILSYVFTWVFAVMLARGVTWSQLLQIATLMCVLAISIVHLVNPNITGWWEEQLIGGSKQLTEMVSAMLNQPATALTDTQIERINFIKQYMNGIIAAAILICALLQVIVARWWEAAVFVPGMLRRELHNLRLSPLAGALFLLSMILGYMGNRVVLDMLPVLYVLFAACGLSLLHYFLGLMRSATKWFWLCLLYITIIIGGPYSIVLLAMLGLLDIWMDMRKRIRPM